MQIIINRASSGGCIEVFGSVGVSTEEEVEKFEWRGLFVYEIICDRLRINLCRDFLDGIVGRINLRLFPGGWCSGHDDWEECLSGTSMVLSGHILNLRERKAPISMRNCNPRAHHSGLSSHNCRMIAILENPLPDNCRGKFKLEYDAVELEDGARLCTTDANSSTRQFSWIY